MNFLKQKYQTALETVRAHPSGSYSFEEFAAGKLSSHRPAENILEHLETEIEGDLRLGQHWL